MQLDFFHNTIGLLPSEKAVREEKATKQVDHILKFFKNHPKQDFTPTEVWLAFGQQFLLTSVRRSISDLTTAGDLEKTDRRRKGIYNELNYTWRLRIKP